MINSKTKLCCIIGNPVEHSLSPQMHNAAYEALGLNFIYLAFKISDVKKGLSGLKELGVKGISVTIPHKQEVMKYLDEIDETAKAIGAVNMIINDHGILKASNSDWIGALVALKEKTNLMGKNVALLGAGGAARALAYGLTKEKAIVSVFNRSRKKADLLTKEFHLKNAYSILETEKIKQMEIIINTTSVGMEPTDGESPIPAECISPHQVVFDIVYTPHKTKLLQYAKEKGATIVYGYKMVLYGGTRIFEMFTGRKAPVAVMEKVLLENLHH